MNSSTLEPQSGDINFRDFTKRRMPVSYTHLDVYKRQI